jgi:hypothetical protein
MHLWGHTALSALNTVKGKAHDVLLRGGVVIEAVDDEEMPEQLLVGAYLIRLDHRNRSVALPTESEAFLTDPANHVEPLARHNHHGGSGGAHESTTPGASPPSLSPTSLSPREGEEGAASWPISDGLDPPDTARTCS